MKQSHLFKLAAALAEISIGMPSGAAAESTTTLSPSISRPDAAPPEGPPPHRVLNSDEFEMYRLLGKGWNISQISFYFTLSPHVAARMLGIVQAKMGCKTHHALKRQASEWLQEHG